MKKSFLAVAIFAGLVSCKKNNPAPTNPCVVNSASVAGTYKITSVTYKASSSATGTDSFAGLPDCVKDDTYEFRVDGSIKANDAGLSCNLPPIPGSVEGWSLENNSSVFRMSGIELQVESFDCTRLVVYQKDILVPGDRSTTTYIRQ